MVIVGEAGRPQRSACPARSLYCIQERLDSRRGDTLSAQEVVVHDLVIRQVEQESEHRTEPSGPVLARMAMNHDALLARSTDLANSLHYVGGVRVELPYVTASRVPLLWGGVRAGRSREWERDISDALEKFRRIA